MSGIFDRLATRVAGSPPGLAQPRVPSRFETLPEEAGFAEPAPVADPVGAVRAPLAAPPQPATLSTPPAEASVAPAPLVGGASSASWQAAIAGTPLAASVAAAPPARQLALVQRRATETPAIPSGDMASMPAASPSSEVPATQGGADAAGFPPAMSQSPISRIEEVAAEATTQGSRPEATVPRAIKARPDRGTPAASSPVRAEVQVRQAIVPVVVGEAPVEVAMPGPAATYVTASAPQPGQDAAPAPMQADIVRVEVLPAERGPQLDRPEPARETPPQPAYAATPVARPHEPSPQQAQPPIVEVHVGSVEIRAAAPPALPAAPAGPASRSLDEFLAGHRAR